MSNALAIATTTTALAQIVRSAAQSVVPGAEVVTGPPDPDASPSHRVHLFLYHVSPNAALRNNDLPTRSADGKLTNRPAVALDLHYLLAFYGDDSELETQRMLGAVSRDLHAQPVLARQMIRDAVSSQPFLNDSNLVNAIEQVKFTPQPLSLEELSNLWSVFFQTPYALSIAFLGTVGVIESEEQGGPAPPVLRRGDLDRGPEAFVGQFPILDSIHIGAPEDDGRVPRPPSYRSATLGALLTIDGRNLGGETVRVRFSYARLFLEDPHRPLERELTIPTCDRTATRIKVLIPDDAVAHTEWAAGLASVTVVITDGTKERSTNELPLSIAPRITKIEPNPVPREADGSAILKLTVAPQVRPGQRAALQIADREVDRNAQAAATDTLTFVIKDAPAVTGALVRVRVDGVDSQPFRRQAQPRPPRLVFDEKQRVTIQ